MNPAQIWTFGLLFALGFGGMSLSGDTKDFRMDYRFKPAHTLRYQVERQDSLFLRDGTGGAAAVSFFRITQSVRLLEEKDGKRFRISIVTDSLWKGPDTQSPVNQYEKMLFGCEYGATEEKLDIASNGDALSKHRRFIPFLIPLPSKTVTEDGAWEFSVTTPFEKPFQGHILTSGDCQLYQVKEESGDSLATMAVRIEKTNSAEMSIREPFQTLTSLYETADRGAGALYFNISRGRMEKGVIQWSGTVRAQEAGVRKVYRRKSRLTFRLLPE
jgi:hypothetical protein